MSYPTRETKRRKVYRHAPILLGAGTEWYCMALLHTVPTLGFSEPFSEELALSPIAPQTIVWIRPYLIRVNLATENRYWYQHIDVAIRLAPRTRVFGRVEDWNRTGRMIHTHAQRPLPISCHHWPASVALDANAFSDGLVVISPTEVIDSGPSTKCNIYILKIIWLFNLIYFLKFIFYTNSNIPNNVK